MLIKKKNIYLKPPIINTGQPLLSLESQHIASQLNMEDGLKYNTIIEHVKYVLWVGQETNFIISVNAKILV